MINKDQIAGAAKTALGKTQVAAGKAVDNKSLQAKGLKNQVKGSLQARKGDAIEAVDDAAKAVKSEVGGP
ncbi:CsbD family protein [Curvibacter gracilis]|uniref:CsbD family protein n=1 Tax=Curvibacter gracilis TaxID=230310 RepID=UPI0004BC6B7B